MNHTQGKLEIENDMGDSWLLVDENGYVVARDNTVNTDNNPELSKANAQHLKRGWNNHDELLEACEDLISLLAYKGNIHGFDPMVCSNVRGAKQAISNAKEASR